MELNLVAIKLGHNCFATATKKSALTNTTLVHFYLWGKKLKRPFHLKLIEANRVQMSFHRRWPQPNFKINKKIVVVDAIAR